MGDKLILPPGAQVNPTEGETPEQLEQRFALSGASAGYCEHIMDELLAGYRLHPNQALAENRAAESLASGALSAAIKLFVAHIPNHQFATPRDVIQAMRPAIEHYAELHLAGVTPKN